MLASDNLYVFDLAPKVIAELELLKFDSLTSIASLATEIRPVSSVGANPSSTSKNQRECTSCKTEFGANATREDVASHYKSDFHRLNLKRGVNGLEALTETQFEELVETQSLESISGSEESDSEGESGEDRLPTVLEKLSVGDVLAAVEDDEESLVSHMNTKLPFLLLKSPLLSQGKAYGAYKALFDSSLLEDGAIIEALKLMNSEASRTGLSVLLMIGGGHFAGAVVSHQLTKSKGNPKNHKESMDAQRVVVLELKTFHRYTTRRKQGGSQSASDNARGKANSAGSSIRRYNEEALKKEVHELLTLWKDYIAKAEHIFIRATGAASKKILVGYEGAEIKSSDKRVKSFPFTTKRATLTEVKSAWAKLTYMVPVELPKTQRKNFDKKSSSSTPVVERTPEPVAVAASDVHTKEIVGLLRKSKAPFLINYLRKNGLDANFRFTPSEQYGHTPTLLHFAASQSLPHMVKVLLVNLKADPSAKNNSGKTAAQLANNDEQTKNTFQICRSTLGELFCDWDSCNVGPPKTVEEVTREAEEAKQRALKETARVIEEELAKKTETEAQVVEPKVSTGGRLGGTILSSVSDMSGMTEQQKMRFMREQRARAAMARMSANKG